MTLRFTLRADPEQRLDLSPLTPDRLAGLERGEIDRIALNTTREAVHVGDIFRVRGSGADQVNIEGGSDRFDRVGAEMTRGSLLLDGDAGAQAGRRMKGGSLEITGDTGPFAATGLRGGQIEIAGDVGDFLGGPLAGERSGMAGGMVIVRGSAGARACDRLRRGLIVIEGDAGEACGSRMIAGSVIVCGEAAPLAGYLMRRGTLIVARVASMLPTFVPVGGEDLIFTRLLVRVLQPVSRRAARLAVNAVTRFAGDMAAVGKGELFLAES